MAEKAYGGLSEDNAKARIGEALARLRRNRHLGTETKAADDNSSVDYHIDNIVKAGGGLWNETVARDYIQNLESQVGDEREAPLKLT